MKNTRLYFDKDFKPITKDTLYFRIPGLATADITEPEVLVPYNSVGADNSNVNDPNLRIGFIKQDCQNITGHTFEEVLQSPHLFKVPSGSPNPTEIFVENVDGSTYARYETLDDVMINGQKYAQLYRKGEIVYDMGPYSSTVTAHDGTNLGQLQDNPFKFSTPSDALSISQLSTVFFNTKPLDIDITNYKYIKVVVDSAMNIILHTDEARKYFTTDSTSDASTKHATFYLLNTNYKEPAIYINVTGDTGTFYMENIDTVTNVHKANLSKQADGTWTLDFQYDLKDGHIEMFGVRGTITSISNDLIKANSPIYQDTTYGPKPVSFRVWEVN